MIDKRLMYAQGRRVGFQGGGRDAGKDSDFGSEDFGGSNDTGNDDNDYNYTGPADLGVTTRTVNTIDAPEAYEIIGGQKYDVTPATKDIREKAEVKQAILNPTVKKNKIFDPISKNFIDPFAPTVTKKTPWERTKQIFSVASVLSPHTLVGKIGLGLTTYNRAKTGLETVATIADQFGFENPLGNMFSENKTSKSTATTATTATNTNNGGDGDGIASLNNQAGSYDEYILLLQKLQSGNITDAEQNRYNVLKNMLGI